MEAHLVDDIRNTRDGIEAEAILRSCVHCGFCNATCPTYQLTGDELDGPRGRIYQIKRMLEGEAPGAATQLHLDRCLTCRNCETTCPSGVKYGRLVDIGRAVVAERVPRPTAQRWQRAFLRFALTRRWLFDPAVRLGRALRKTLPAELRAKISPVRDAGAWPHATHARKVLVLNGCVQPALIPSIDAATARVLDACGVEAIVASNSGCCGALDFHLDAHAAAQAHTRRNIDAWLPLLDAGVDAIVINASACSAMVKGYAHLLRDDASYAEKAQRIVAAARDLAEYLPPLLQSSGARAQAALPDSLRRVAFHPPCTLQHAQKIAGAVEAALVSLGAELVPFAESHLCCGSAGTYSILQPEFSQRLRERKLEHLQRGRPAMILSANIGCLTHLETAAQVPVRHWIEWVDGVLARPG
jgi:glycolate oxidase iron-sulfur subunit